MSSLLFFSADITAFIDISRLPLSDFCLLQVRLGTSCLSCLTLSFKLLYAGLLRCCLYMTVSWHVEGCFCSSLPQLCYLPFLAKKFQAKIFLPYGRSIRSWLCLTHKTYTCHTVQNTYSASMAVSDSQSIFRFNLSCLSYSALFHFLSRMRCTSMGVWGSMIY
jgi:hypothetical protein